MTLTDTLAAHAAATPHATFLLGAGRAPATYASAYAGLAAFRAALAAQGVRRGHRLAIVLPGGAESAAAVLGVMGCATAAPLDPELTRDEVTAMLSRLGVHALLTSPEVGPAAADAAAALGLPILRLHLPTDGDAAALEVTAERPVTAIPPPGRDEVALALQTSGTTGEPRVVPLTHANLAAAASAMVLALGLEPDDRSLAVMPLFHIHGLSMVFASLAAGGSAACPGRFQAPRFLDWLRDYSPTWLSAAPTIHRAILERAPREHSLRFLRSASSAMPPSLIAAMEERFGVPFVEAYGMTEAAPQIACNPLPPAHRKAGSVGLPAGPEVAVVDGEGQRLGAGQKGEVVVRGANVTAGYEGDESATRRAFIGGWLRTGDEGFLDDDGYLHVTGRLKDVINRGGEKISPREIDDVLTAHPAVAQAVAFGVADERLGEEVAAAVVLEHGRAADEESLMAFARQRLATFKVPRRVLIVERLPQGATAKVSRREVARVLGPRVMARAEDATASEALVDIVREVWATVLEIPTPPADADFFALGGDSLTAASAASRLRISQGVDVSVVDFFGDGATPRGLAARLQRRQARAAAAINGAPAISFAQQRLWFMDQLSPGTPIYNMARAWRARGPLDEAALGRALNALVVRHEALRTVFDATNGVPRAVVTQDADVGLRHLDLSQEGEAARERTLSDEVSRPFDLARGPLLRAVLARLGPDDHVLLLVAHHIAFDDWSAGVLASDLSALYESALPPLPMQYGDYARWQRSTLDERRLHDLQQWWRETLRGAAPLRLPAPRGEPFEGPAELRVALSAELVERLVGVGRSHGATLFMTMLAAWNGALAAVTGQRDLVVGTDDAHRERPETEAMIGFFVNLLPLRTDLSGDPTFGDLLTRVRDSALAALDHQALPFDKLVEAVQPARGDGVPLLPVLFVFQNAPNHPLRLGAARVEPHALPPAPSRFDLAAFVRCDEGGWTCRLSWRRERLDDAFVDDLARRFLHLLEAGAADAGRRLSDMASLPARTRPGAARRRGVPLGEAEAVRTAPMPGGMPLLVTPLAEGVDLAAWSRAHRPRVDALLYQHGALLFRGFGIRDEGTLETVASAMCDGLFGEYGDLPSVAGRIYRSTPYPPDKRILYHNESAHTPRWPSRQWFCCVQPSAVGGDTPIVDCRAVLRALPKEDVERFRRLGLMYVRNFIPGLDVSWRDFFRTRSRDEVEAECRAAGVEFQWLAGDALRTRQRAPAVLRHPVDGEEVFFNQILLHHPATLDEGLRASLQSLFSRDDMPRDVRHGDGSPIPDELVERVLACCDNLAVAFPWQSGDVLMVDNMRVAHARNAYQEPRRILVALGDMVEASQVWKSDEEAA